MHRRILLVLAVLVTATALQAGCGGEGTATGSNSSGSNDTEATIVPNRDIARNATSTPIPTATLPAINGDRVRIPAIGVDAEFTFEVVPASGSLPNPDGPDQPVLYDFSEFERYGGVPGDGTAVMFGNPDSGSQPCNGGREPPACKAVFWDLRLVKPGDRVIVDWQNQRYVYAVVSLCWIPRREPLEEIYETTDAPTLTLATAGGDFDFDSASYSHLLYVRAEAESGTLDVSCPGASTAPPQPEPTPTPAPPAEVTITSLAAVVSIGGQLHVEAMTTTGAQCFLRIYSSDGVPEQGTVRDVEEASGLLVIDWRIRDSVSPGNKRFEIGCGGEPESRELSVTQ